MKNMHHFKSVVCLQDCIQQQKFLFKISVSFFFISFFLLSKVFAVPPNDDCSNAILIECGETLFGTTVDATPTAVGLCGTSATAPGVFYSFVGTGQSITVSLCGGGTDYDTKLGVFEGDCQNLICVGGNDDFCGLASEVTFQSVNGVEYFFYVHGFGSAVGNFEISITCSGGGGGGNLCSNPGSLISFNNPTTIDQIVVNTGSPDVIIDLNVSINITHTWIGDLTIFLESPSGTSILLYDNCSFQENMDAIFDDGTSPISCPPIGTFSPLQALANFIGESPDGIWTLSVTDNFDGDDGILNEWCLIPTLGAPITVPNDDCADAISVECGDLVFGTTTGATTDFNAGTCGTSVTSPGVWYKLIGDGSLVTASTCNSASFDTKIGVYTDGCGNLTCVAGNDDFTGCAGFTSEVSFPTDDGVEYLILVHGFGGAVGDFALSITCEALANNDDCTDALPISCGQLIQGSTIGTNADNAATCVTSNTSPGVWYSYTGTGEFVIVSTCNNADFDTKLSVYTDGCGTLTCVTGNDDAAGCFGFTSELGFLSEAGREYLVLVHGFGGATGSFTLSITCQPILLANDNCADVAPVVLTNGIPATFTGTTIGATPSFEETNILGATAVWEAVTLTGNCNILTMDYCGTGAGIMETAFVVYTDCPASVFSAGDFDFVTCPDGNLTVTFTGIPAGTYYLPVVADANFNTPGDYIMNVSSVDCPAPPANDNVCFAEPLTLGVGAPYDLRFTTAEPGEVSPGAGSLPGLGSCESQDGWCNIETEVQNSQWFTFVAPLSGYVIVFAEGIDAQLAVYSVENCADFSTFTVVGANDDSYTGCQFCPQVELKCLIPGETYYVQLDGFDGTKGTGTITAFDPGLTNVVTSYTLVNSTTNQDIGPLQDGDIINLRNFPPFTIRANTCREVGSVRFHVNGNLFQTENIAPYSLTGDNPTGNYRPWNVTPGFYELTTNTYNGTNGSGGLAGLTDIINFEVIDDDCVFLTIEVTTDFFGVETSWEIFDLTENTSVASIFTGSLADETSYRWVLCVPATHCYEFRIFDTFGDGICCDWGFGSYSVTFDGAVVASGGAFGASEITDFGNCVFDCNGVLGGSAVEDTNGTCCQPDELDCDGVCFGPNVSGLQVVGFTLVDAASNVDLGPLNDGDVIDLAVNPSVNIRAEVCSEVGLGSVRFKINTRQYRIENETPYAMAGDKFGNYNKWHVRVGDYFIEAIPHAGANGSGTAGTLSSINVTVINSGGTPKHEDEMEFLPSIEGLNVFIQAFPNPFTDQLTFDFSVPEDSRVSLEIFNVTGMKVATVFEGNVNASQLYRETFNPGDLAGGFYLYRFRTNDLVITEKVMLAR